MRADETIGPGYENTFVLEIHSLGGVGIKHGTKSLTRASRKKRRELEIFALGFGLTHRDFDAYLWPGFQ
jgi:hypothetical protein